MYKPGDTLKGLGQQGGQGQRYEVRRFRGVSAHVGPVASTAPWQALSHQALTALAAMHTNVAPLPNQHQRATRPLDTRDLIVENS